MLNRSVSLAMSTRVHKALPGKLDIKRHSSSILYFYPIKPMEEEEVEEEEADSAQEYRNDGYIELVLKVMARMCDGQNHHLQVYM